MNFLNVGIKIPVPSDGFYSHVIQRIFKSEHSSKVHLLGKFEEDFAAFSGTRYAVGVESITEALRLTMLALGIRPGDEVITAPNAFMQTPEAICECGATPVFSDVDPVSYTISPRECEKSITPKTKAIIPVFLFGEPADMDPIQEIARKHGLAVIADGCQAHGAEYKGQKAAKTGDAVCLSHRLVSRAGVFEIGAVATDNQELQQNIRTLRARGESDANHHASISRSWKGTRWVMFSGDLSRLEENVRWRRAYAHYYDQAISQLGGIFRPVEAAYAKHAYQTYAIRTRNRNQVIRLMREKGVECSIHCPVPVHLQEAYRHLGYKPGAFPITEQCAKEFISLPMHPDLKVDQLNLVIESLTTAVDSISAGQGRQPQLVNR